jgi:PrtD family type I secretion system ABC transporter
MADEIYAPREALRYARPAILTASALSLGINLLGLAPALFMLQVYDRVLTSRSVETLTALIVLLLIALACQCVFMILRGRLLVRAGDRIEHQLEPLVFRGTLQNLNLVGADARITPERDLANLRGFVSGMSLATLFDLPWVPVYLIILFLVHPWLGSLALIGAGVIVLLTVFNYSQAEDEEMRQPISLEVLRKASLMPVDVASVPDAAETLWRKEAQTLREQRRRKAEQLDVLSNAAKHLRVLLTSAMLALAAYLAIRQLATSGVMIASSILMGRLLTPVEGALASLHSMKRARSAYRRLADLSLALRQNIPGSVSLDPKHVLTIERVTVAAGGSDKGVIRQLGFATRAGDIVVVAGASGTGKSLVARALIGALPLKAGRISLDGHPLSHWDPVVLARKIGYCAQSPVFLPAKTVAEIIGRGLSEAGFETVLQASRAFNLDTFITRLPKGYATPFAEIEAQLCAGQRQKFALARAFCAEPFLVVLDDPMTYLDQEGAGCLAQELARHRKRGGIAVVASQDSRMIALASHLLVLSKGLQVAFGPREKVLAKMNEKIKAAPQIPARPAMEAQHA